MLLIILSETFKHLDKIFMGTLGLASAVSVVFIFREIVLSTELKDFLNLRKLYKILTKLNYLKENSPIIKNRSFLNNIVNYGNHPCDLQQEIVVDNSYLSVDSDMFINFEVNKDE